jgi:hypothetical protein
MRMTLVSTLAIWDGEEDGGRGRTQGSQALVLSEVKGEKRGNELVGREVGM